MGTPFLYGLIVIYFVGLTLMAFFVLARPNSARDVQQMRQSEQARSPALLKNSLAYGIVAAIFAFFLVLTVLAQHDTSHRS